MNNTSRWLAILLGLHLLLGLVYDWATPIFEAPDEGTHFAMARWISLGHGLPVQEPGVKTDWEQEGSQPPLYHALVAALTGWIDTSDWNDVFVWNHLSRIGVPGTSTNANLYRHTSAEAFPYHNTALAVHVGRWASLGLSLITIVLAYWLSLAVYPKREKLALLAAALVALNPQAIFINASVNNDNLLMLLSTATLLLIVRFMPPTPALESQASRFRRDLPWLFLLGLLLGLAALTKVSGLVLWPMAALGVGWGCLNAQRNWRKAEGWRFVASGAVIAGVALLVSGWWFWRNQVLYGDWLGLSTMVAIAGPRTITLVDLIRNEWYSFYSSYWGVFGVFTILSPAWAQAFFGLLTGLSLAGGAVALVRRRAWPRAESWLLALTCALTLAGVIRWTMETFASQGRLAFGALAPLSIFMALGLAAAGRLLAGVLRFRFDESPPWILNWGLGVFIFGLSAVALVLAVVYIAPHYAPPPVVAESQLPRDIQPVHVAFGGQIELIGCTSDTAVRHPGESLRVTLYWRARRPLTQDYALALHLIGRGVEEVGKLDTWPGGGNAPTSQWQPGVILADTYWLPITRSATTPSQLKLNLAFWEGQADNQLPITAASGEPLKTVTLNVGRVAPAQPPVFKPAIVEGTKFEYGISLAGADVGDAGRLTLYWQTNQSIPADYTIFLHLVDASGRQVAQADGPPLNGDWPTSAWVPGQALADVRQFDLAPGLAPGRYTVQLGFYDPASGARVGAFRSDGGEWPDDIVLLKDVVEIK
jgi:hypothetical protein